MALRGKLETDVDLKACAKKFYEICSQRPHHVCNVSNNNIQNCDLHQGDWGKVGTVIYWNYVHDGKACVAKEIVETIDTETNLVSFQVIEGDLMEHFKTVLLTIQVTPKDEGSNVHWTIEYEKHDDDITDPHTLLEFFVEVTKDIDAHLLPKHSNTCIVQELITFIIMIIYMLRI